MTKNEIKIVLIAVVAVGLINRFDATRNLLYGGNRFFG